ncbi:MAG: Asp/Glu racemase [Deltaproteobacteria bacterium]
MTDLRHRVGLLVPAGDSVMEPDLWRGLPRRLTLHVTRMYLESATVAGEKKMLTDELEPAARRIAQVGPELVIFGCTSAAAILGLEGEADIVRRVERAAGCRCLTVMGAAIEEISQHSPERLLLVTPYIDEINDRLQATFRAAGFPVCDIAGMGLVSESAIGAVEPRDIRRFAVDAARRAGVAPDCVFVSCTTFRALEAAQAISRELAIPVVTSNQSVLKGIERYFASLTNPLSA